MKVEQVEQGNGYVKVGSTINKSDQVLVVKVEQVEKGSGFMKEKGDRGIRVLDRLYNLKFKKYIYYCWIQKSIRRSYKITTLKKGRY